VRRVHEKWKFTFIEVLKSEREINEIIFKMFYEKNVLD